ncbi:TetR/AcrR family transcriptional regulator [Zavarzinia sp.]|uniref:TetR/AcrR family transcriptional regulator n=1 Tax=Zavarzinia sp. TaxID=2027920 RepID=UPI003565566B
MMHDQPLPEDPPARRRLSAEERRRQILAAAREVFTEEGIERASMRRIADRAGVTPTLIYRHFADKESLLLAICQDFFRGLIERAESDPPPSSDEPFARLRRQMRIYVDFGLEHPDVYRLVFMTRLAGLKRGDLAQGHRLRNGCPPPPESEGFGTRAFAMLENEIARLIETGAVKPMEPSALAEAVWALGHGLVSLLITHDDFDWTPLEHLLDAAMETVLHGIAR